MDTPFIIFLYLLPFVLLNYLSLPVEDFLVLFLKSSALLPFLLKLLDEICHFPCLPLNGQLQAVYLGNI